MQIRHFHRFRQNGPFLAGDKNTVYQKHGLCHPELLGSDTNQRKHMNISLMPLAGQSSLGQTPPEAGRNGTKWRFDCANEQGTAA